MNRSISDRVAHRYLRSYRPPAGDLPGTNTFVTERSQKGLPPSNLQDKRPLPIPSGHSKNRDNKLPQPYYQTPDADRDLKPRTLPKPGEEYGVPYKAPSDDTVGPRRTMTGRQKEQRGQKKRKDAQRYRRNKNKYKTRAKKRNKRLKGKIKRQQKLRRRNPQRFKRRKAGVLTAPDIAFVIGKDLDLGYVHSVSPMTGLVVFHVGGIWRSLPVHVFLCAAGFLSEEDIEAMFSLVDAEIGLDAYADLTSESVEATADLFGINWGGTRFGDLCEELVEMRLLDDMSAADLFTVEGAIISGYYDDAFGDNDPHPEDRTDPKEEDLYHGEVLKGAAYGGDSWFREEKAPSQLPNNWRKDDSKGVPGITPKEAPKGLTTWPLPMSRDQDREKKTPAHSIDRGQVTDNPGSAKVIPRGKGFENKEAATMSEIMSATEQKVHDRSEGIPVKLRRVDPKNAAWLFDSGKYKVRLKAIRKGRLSQLSKANVEVSCSCPYWRWQGPEHWGKSEKYQRGKPRGTASEPVIKDPEGVHWACKHVLAVFRVAEKYPIPKWPGAKIKRKAWGDW